MLSPGSPRIADEIHRARWIPGHLADFRPTSNLLGLQIQPGPGTVLSAPVSPIGPWGPSGPTGCWSSYSTINTSITFVSFISFRSLPIQLGSVLPILPWCLADLWDQYHLSVLIAWMPWCKLDALLTSG